MEWGYSQYTLRSYVGSPIFKLIKKKGGGHFKLGNIPIQQPYPQAQYTTTKMSLEGTLLFSAPMVTLGLPPQPQLDWQEVKPTEKNF